MLLQERLKLRDELFEIFKSLLLIVYTTQYNTYRYSRRKIIYRKIKDNIEVLEKYNKYISEFRSEEEALYCLIYKDDCTNHICPICKKDLCKYYNMKHGYRKTCNCKNCLDKLIQSDENKQKREQSNLNIYGYKCAAKSDIWKENRKRQYFENHKYITTDECHILLNEIKAGLTLADAYSVDEYFKEFIYKLYICKGKLLQVNDICNIFNIKSSSAIKKIHKYNIEKYFDIPDSKFELQFRDLLIDHGYKEKEDFIRHNYILKIKSNNTQEIDFLLPKYSIGFEINDYSHNINRKASNYHIDKTLLAREQHNIRLIHLWEWELDNSNWSKISQWILHILNQSKVQLYINSCIVQYITKDEAIKFLDQYSLDNNRDFDDYIGIYYNNELVEILSFKGNILSICIRFGHELVRDTERIIQFYMKYKNLNHILTYIDLSKFTGNTITELNFKLLKYQKPNIIFEMNNQNSKCKQIYNCGYNIFTYSLLKGDI